MVYKARFLLAGILLIALGGWLASSIQTAGRIDLRDIRFTAPDGTVMSALLYVPQNATAETPAPGILAVHGYINSRETQDGFAIEFARRGYVVLALDQTGHGFSGGPAFSAGFGGPAGLAHLRSFDFVDKDNIGLEGHSMGGWTVLAAAAAMPDAYRSMVLAGSSTGAPFAQDGSPTWPRNLEVVFSRYDEFSDLMWGIARGRDVASSAKLQAVFGTDVPVEVGKLYGSIAEGTARQLATPATTHPGDHISPTAIGASLDWFAKTLTGGTAKDIGQIWYWKEIGTLIALIGFGALLLGAFELLLALPVFASLRQAATPAVAVRDRSWWTRFAVTAFLPILTFFPFFILAGFIATPNVVFKQGITNQVLVWALLNAGIALLLGRVMRVPKADFAPAEWPRVIALSLATILVGYFSLELAGAAFTIDFRFWVVALKLLTLAQFKLVLVYLVPFTLFFAVLLRGLHQQLALAGDSAARQYLGAIGALASGFLALLVLDYGALFINGRLLTFFDPLSTIVAIQFLPLMAFIGLVSTFTYRRTNSYLPGALICGMLVTWYIVAGTATQSI